MYRSISILGNEECIVEEMKKGKIFIYPTDTVYGIGCIATDSQAISKIYEIKKRDSKPFLIIIPDFSWITTNCDCSSDQLDFIKQHLPGPYSFVLKYVGNSISNKLVSQNNTIGVRIPNCSFASLVREVPFITTSVNFSGEPPAKLFSEIPLEILNQVDYVISNDNEVSGTPSTIYDLSQGEIKQLR
jgi:L-threonylcarbamoyladenylate synthase